MGAFDDLIPKPKGAPAAPTASAPGGAFGDLVPKPPGPGMLEAAARGVARGATFGFNDEAYGLMQGLASMAGGGSFRDGYDRAVTEFRARDKAASDANPITSGAAEIAGGIGTGLGAMRAGATLMRGGMSLPQMMGAGAVEGAGYGALQGAGNAEGGLAERVQAGKDGAIAGAIIGGAIPVVARGVGAAANKAVSPVGGADVERQAAIAVLEREGVPLSAGQRTGSKALQYAESFLGDAPGAGGKASAAMAEQGEAFTNAAMKRVGASGRATPENLTAARDRISGVFDDVASRNVVQADRQMASELGLSLKEYDRVLPADQRQIVGNLATDIVQRFQAGNGAMPGRDYQTIRSRLSRMAQNTRQTDPEFSQAVRSLRDALDNAATRSVSPDDAAAWATARREWGNLKTVERAAAAGGENAASGLVSPAQLRIAASQGAGNRGAYARGEGDFGELARAGNALMTPLPNSGTAQRSLMTGGAVGAGGTAALTADPLMGAVIAAGPAAFGRALWAGPVQRYLSGQPIPPGLRAVIEDRARAAIQGGAQSQVPALSEP